VLLTLGLCLAAQDPAAARPPSLWERLSLDASGRIRGESTFDQLNGEDRHRGRMRLRLGARYELTEEVAAAARLSTASDPPDANNPHWDFGEGSDAFQGGDVVLDRFYLDWQARAALELRAGKFGHAYSAPPVVGEFLWDDDVQPAGLAAVWAPAREEGRMGYDLRAVEYVAVENGGDDDSTLFGLQGNLYLTPGEASALQLATSYSNWSSLDANAGSFGNQGNTDVTGDFGIIDAFALYTLDKGPLDRVQAFAEVMYNAEDDDGEDTGYALGARLGKWGAEDDLNVFASWYDLDANAVFSPVSQDDTPIPGTGVGDGMQGVIAGGQYFVADNLSIKLWGLTSDADAAEDPYRIRLDFDFTIK
jgi:hypothetical protein